LGQFVDSFFDERRIRGHGHSGASVRASSRFETRAGRETYLIVKVLPNDDYSRLARIGMTGPDTPITLKDACKHCFSDAITVATLKAEHKRGNLVIFKIGRQYFTTLAEIKSMLEKCRMETPHRKEGWSARGDNIHAAMESAALIALRLKLANRNRKA
jgi:hypothetical protein